MCADIEKDDDLLLGNTVRIDTDKVKSTPARTDAVKIPRDDRDKAQKRADRERARERAIPEKKKRAKMKESVAAPLLAAVLFAFILLSRALDIEKLAGDGNVFLVVIVIELMIFILPGIFYVRIKGTGYVTAMNLRFFPLGAIPMILFSLVVLICGTILVQFALFRTGIVSAADGAYEAYAYITTGDDFSSFGKVLYAAVVFAVIPAICEEFIFRSVIMTEYEKLGGVAAVAAVSLLFAMSHFDAKQFVVYLFAGIVLSTVAFVTRSVLATMVIHVLYNLFALFAQSFVWALITQSSTTIFFVFIIASLFLLFLMLSFGEAERLTKGYARDGQKSEAEKANKRTQKPIVEALLSPTFLICCGIFLLAAMLSK